MDNEPYTLSNWTKEHFKHIELSDEPVTMTILKNGATMNVTRTPDKTEVELTLGLLSTDNIEDWTRIAFHLAPAGILVDKMDEEFYKDMLLLLRSKLTKLLLDSRSKTMAEKFLGILERRDKDRWGLTKKETAVSVQDKDKDINLIFTVKE